MNEVLENIVAELRQARIRHYQTQQSGEVAISPALFQSMKELGLGGKPNSSFVTYQGIRYKALADEKQKS